MKAKKVFCLLLVILYVTVSESQDPCLPDCTNHPTGHKVPHPKYCSMYYVCSSGLPIPTPYACDSYLEFQENMQDCITPYGCTPACPPTGCHLTCTGDGDNVADPLNCNIYYPCTLSGPGEAQQCEDTTPYFDGTRCGIDATRCCEQGCDPYCEIDVLQVPDPTDCTKYYMCNPNPLYPIYPSVSCGSGLTFNYGTGHCSADAECKILCSGGPGPGDCSDNFICEASGFFPRCTYCDPTYFVCEGAGQPGIEDQCAGGMVFNPVPGYPYCLPPEECPYAPLE